MFFSGMFLYLLTVGVIAEDGIAEDTLILVHAMVRHGDRTPDPMSAYPKDVYKNHTYFPWGDAELNKKGIQRSFKVGKQLRRRYDHFLGPKYYPEIVEAISSGFSRCRMTMQILLAAIFPPHPSQIFREGLSWQPIVYKYDDTKKDFLVSFITCLNYLEAIPLKEEFNLCKNREFLYKYLTEHSGLDINSPMRLASLHDCLRVEEDNGLILPDWTKSIWKEPMNTCAYDFYRNFLSNQSALATTGGVFMKKLVADTNEKIKENSHLDTRKLVLYSGHDYNIYLLLGILESLNNTIVNYSSYLLFEIHRIDDVYGYKVYFENHNGTGLRQLEIPRCGMFCPVDDFYESMKIYLNSTHCPIIRHGNRTPEPRMSFPTDSDKNFDFCSYCKEELNNNLKFPTCAEYIWPEPLKMCAHDIWRDFLDNKTNLAQFAGNILNVTSCEKYLCLLQYK